MEPLYSFTIPSIEDDTPLDCRIYHRTKPFPGDHAGQRLRGAVLAHPYAPLGGCYDDPVVLSLTETLLSDGHIVMTFNFRYKHSRLACAGESAGRTSWTGNNEVLDYCSVVGLLFHYMQHFQIPNTADMADSHSRSLELLLGGYSFGALILARLPPVHVILDRFETAERGAAASEIILRARKLATQTPPATQNIRSPRRCRKIGLSAPHESQSRASPTPRQSFTMAYLLISPVLLPLTSTLCPPGFPFPLTFHGDSKDQPLSGLLSLHSPSLIIFGAADGFTSSKRLQQWVKRLCHRDSESLRWEQVDHAGHFWREAGVMQRLQYSVAAWCHSVHS
ncbi:hypothetical protein DOTSEDRAFT_118514 [Dothistroma septosporum NZE10]|uniref:AB hydrolase-1 domain-containing protein n=1 Tax=Dothistroma septosporum (strain NZE10 / CBS 128990) TaxID=675120 RepID=N1Q1P7_DOTSN|nr:hypothetical protein DOTSEDRAFT_118514 [Dothistroma septosporum NZE10]